MKILGRVLLLLLALCGLAGLLAILSVFTTVPWLSGFTRGLLSRYTWLPLAFSILLLVLIAALVFAIILILTVPTRRKLFTVQRDTGRIEITRQSIESAAARTMDTMPEVKRYHVQAKGDMKPQKLKVKVQVEPRNGGADLAALGNTIQQRLQDSLGRSLGVETRTIDVRVQPVHYQEQEARTHAKVPRVI